MAWCRARLPSAAVPSSIDTTTPLPRSSGGKIVKNGLPRPVWAASPVRTRSLSTPALGQNLVEHATTHNTSDFRTPRSNADTARSSEGWGRPEPYSVAEAMASQTQLKTQTLRLSGGHPIGARPSTNLHTAFSETAVLGAFVAVLGFAPEPSADFFASGGDSLAAAAVATILGIETRIIFECRTARNLSRHLCGEPGACDGVSGNSQTLPRADDRRREEDTAAMRAGMATVVDVDLVPPVEDRTGGGEEVTDPWEARDARDVDAENGGGEHPVRKRRRLALPSQSLRQDTAAPSPPNPAGTAFVLLPLGQAITGIAGDPDESYPVHRTNGLGRIQGGPVDSASADVLPRDHRVPKLSNEHSPEVPDSNPPLTYPLPQGPGPDLALGGPDQACQRPLGNPPGLLGIIPSQELDGKSSTMEIDGSGTGGKQMVCEWRVGLRECVDAAPAVLYKVSTPSSCDSFVR
jgi:hypothetical protein